MYNTPLWYKYDRFYLHNGSSSTGKNRYLYFILYFTIVICHSFCLFYVLIIFQEHLLIFSFKYFTYMMTFCVWIDIVIKGWHYAIEKVQIYNKYATIYLIWICFMKKTTEIGGNFQRDIYIYFSARFVHSLDCLKNILLQNDIPNNTARPFYARLYLLPLSVSIITILVHIRQ